jgi:archaeal flagellin FlaB
LKKNRLLFFRNWKKRFCIQSIADMGIGAMIIFIAMVLVAGIAASVLIQTANRLEIQAMKTGQETTGEVATGISLIKIEGRKATDIANITITVQPRSGSLDVDLSQTYIEISDTAVKCVLTYLSTEFHEKNEINGDMFQTAFFNSLTQTTFGVIVLEDADNSLSAATPVLNRGDKVSLTIQTTQCFGGTGLGERTDVWGLIQPEEGAPAVFSFQVPSSFSGQSIFRLY